MLDEKLENFCDELHKKFQKFSHYDKRGTPAVVIALLSGFIGIFVFILSPDDFPYDIARIVVASIFIISSIAGIVFVLKSKKHRLNDHEDVIMNAYNAYSYLSSYIQKGPKGGQVEDLISTKNEIHSLYYDIVYSWNSYAKFHPTIPKLETQIGEFVINISKLEQSLKDEKIDKKIIIEILENLIEFFVENKKDSFQEINSKFLKIKNVELEISKEEKIISLIKENIIKKSTIYLAIAHIALIIIGSGGVLAAQHYNLAIEIQAMIFLAVTVTPIILIWVNRLKKKFESD